MAAREDDGFRKARKHERKRAAGKVHGIRAVDDDEAIILCAMLVEKCGDCDPVSGTHVRRVEIHG